MQLDAPISLIEKSEKGILIEQNSKNDAQVKILDGLLKTEKILKERALNVIISAPPLIEREGIGIIRKGTICIIQGRHGSHKSRFGEGLCSLILNGSCLNSFVGFNKNSEEAICVCYIDTERNKMEEFPLSIKSILQNSCSNQGNLDFRFTSLKHLVRKERLNGIKLFLNEVRSGTSKHLFVILDVVTDCISNFNDPTESMELYDYLGNLAENENATFLLIIHENPGSEKARGHLGTEGTNKASTVMSIGFEKNRSNEESDLIRLKFVKLRSAKKPENIYLKYDEIKKGLVLASNLEIQTVVTDRRQVADIEEVVSCLSELMIDSKKYVQTELVEKIKNQFGCSTGTAKQRLKEIEQDGLEIFNSDNSPYHLKSHVVNGKQTTYEMVATPKEKLF